MTSSNANDWFDPIGANQGLDAHNCTRLHISVPLWIIEKIDELAKADFSNRSAAVSKCVAFYAQSHSQQGGVATLEGPTKISAGEGGSTAVPSKAVVQEAVPSRAVPSEVSSEPKVCLGKESENTLYRSRKRSKREIPACLEEFEQQITDFWKEKKGAKSDRAWNLLMKELSAIHAYLKVDTSPKGKESFLDQLELATANRWQGITLKNFKQFSDQPSTPGTKPWQKEEKPYHVPGQFRQGIPTVNLEEVHRRQAEEEAAKKARESF